MKTSLMFLKLIFTDLEGFFDTSINEDLITVTPKESFGNTDFIGNFGVLILVVSILCHKINICYFFDLNIPSEFVPTIYLFH
jgi:hypothetical protein